MRREGAVLAAGTVAGTAACDCSILPFIIYDKSWSDNEADKTNGFFNGSNAILIE